MTPPPDGKKHKASKLEKSKEDSTCAKDSGEEPCPPIPTVNAPPEPILQADGDGDGAGTACQHAGLTE